MTICQPVRNGGFIGPAESGYRPVGSGGGVTGLRYNDVDVPVDDGGDDGDYDGGWDPTLNEISIGNTGTAKKGFFLFDATGIPQGSAINQAYLTLTASQNAAGVTVRVLFAGESADNPVAPINKADADGRTRTVATVYWTNIAAWTADTEYQSPDVSAIIQEIVNRPGFAADAILIFIEDDGSTVTTGNRKIKSWNGDPASAARLYVQWAAFALPIAPTGLAAEPTSSTAMTLTWTDNSAGEDSFRIERCTDGVSYVEVDSVGAGVTTYNDSGLSAGTGYYYRVRARQGSTYSYYSNVVNMSTFVVDHSVSAHSTANQTPPAATWTAINLPSERWDTDAYHDNAINNTRLTVPAGLGGYHIISYSSSGQAGNDYDNQIRLNGVTDIQYSRNYAVGNSGDRANCATRAWQLNAGDYVELRVYIPGGGRPTYELEEYSNEFMMHLAAMPSGPMHDCGAMLWHSADQQILNATWTPLTFDTESWDTHGFHDGVNPTRLTIPAGYGGLYLIGTTMAQVTQAENNYEYAALRVNGATYIAMRRTFSGDASVYKRHAISRLYRLSAGDYVEAMRQTDGGLTTWIESATYSPWFWVQRINV